MLRFLVGASCLVLLSANVGVAQRRPPEAEAAGIISTCRDRGNGAVYGRAVDDFGQPVIGLMVERLPARADCGSVSNDRGWWFVGGLAPGRHTFKLSALDWCVPEPIVVDLEAGDTVRIDRVMVHEVGFGDPLVPQAPRRELLDCRVAQRRWQARLGLAAPFPDTWRLPSEREILIATLSAPPVRRLVRSRRWRGPVPVEYWRPWTESTEQVAGQAYRVVHRMPRGVPSYLLVSPYWIDLGGFTVLVVLEPLQRSKIDLSLGFRRDGDRFVYCAAVRGGKCADLGSD